MLTQYITDTDNLLQKPGASTKLYDDASVTLWINKARGQLAGEGECIRVIGTISTVIGQRAYNFSSINVGVPATTGVQGIIHVRRITYTVASGQKIITPRPWPWFDLYCLNNPVPQQSFPTTWAQYAQGSSGQSTGSAASGSFYIDPPPDTIYTLNCDCVCYPIALANDTTVEAIPYLWTDAVPFFAAYYALLSSQASSRIADANRMMDGYKQFVRRARESANPSVYRFQYEQATDPAQAAKFGIKPQQAAGGG